MRYAIFTTIFTMAPLLLFTDLFASMALLEYETATRIHTVTLKDLWVCKALPIYLVGGLIAMIVTHAAIGFSMHQTFFRCFMLIGIGLLLRGEVESPRRDDVRIPFTFFSLGLVGFVLASICIAVGHITMF